MQTQRERLVNLLADCYENPDLFNSAILGRPPYWSGQRKIAQSVCDYRITVAYTGNAIGKDYLVGGLVPWWSCTRAESLCIVNGPSQTLLGSVTWKEIRNAVANSKIPLGIKTSEGIHGSPLRMQMRGDWGALGYSTTSIERASGQHNRKLFVVTEEASALDDDLKQSIDSLKYYRWLLIGNPIRAEGPFVELIRQAEKDKRDGVPKHLAVNAIQISSRQSPDANKDESDYGLADKTWIAAMERHYGKASLWVKSHIDAIIPEVSAESLIPEAWLDWAANQPQREFLPVNHPIHESKRIAVDLGEGKGRDSSCILCRDDWGVLDVVWGATLGLAEAATQVKLMRAKHGVPDSRITFDALGIGRDFPLHLKRNGINTPIAYAGSGKPQSSQFVNLRTEAAWKLRQRLDPDGATDHRRPHSPRRPFQIPARDYWPRLREELRPLTYELVQQKTKLLDKEKWCIVVGHSPDIADALIQSFAA